MRNDFYNKYFLLFFFIKLVISYKTARNKTKASDSLYDSNETVLMVCIDSEIYQFR